VTPPARSAARPSTPRTSRCPGCSAAGCSRHAAARRMVPPRRRARPRASWRARRHPRCRRPRRALRAPSRTRRSSRATRSATVGQPVRPSRRHAGGRGGGPRRDRRGLRAAPRGAGPRGGPAPGAADPRGVESYTAMPILHREGNGSETAHGSSWATWSAAFEEADRVFEAPLPQRDGAPGLHGAARGGGVV